MAEYIERFELLKKIDDELYLQQSTRSYLKMLVRKQPAADVVEVRHGEWLGERCNHKPYRLNNPEKWVKYKCSECGYSNGRKHSNYCPNCGAKMDGKDGAE